MQKPYCVEIRKEWMEYFYVQVASYGAVLHCGAMFAIQHRILSLLQEDISLLNRGVPAKNFYSKITADRWVLEFTADLLEMAGYQWFGTAMTVRLTGFREILPEVHRRFQTLLTREQLPFRSV